MTNCKIAPNYNPWLRCGKLARMSILSIQSNVASGHVGNAAAVYPLQCLGHDVWPVHTVMLSLHPGHSDWRGHRVPASDLAAVLKGLDDHGVFKDCSAVLTGYLGAADVGDVVVEAWANVRHANPGALICCDPVMGDSGEGLYVPDDLVAFYRHTLVPAADVIMPNVFELETLHGGPMETIEAVIAAAQYLISKGPKTVIVTSVPDGGDALGNILVTPTESWIISTPRLALRAKGSGDVLSALWLGHYLRGGQAVAALEIAVATVFAIVEMAVKDQLLELPIVAAGSAGPAGFNAPRRFKAWRVD